MSDDRAIKIIGELRDIVDANLRFVYGFRQQIGGLKPAAGSNAELEMASDEMGPQPEISLQMADLLLYASGHYLASFKLLLVDEVAQLGFHAVTRGVLEACAWGWWLLDPSIGIRDRAARNWTLRLQSAREATKTAAALKQPDAAGISPAELEELARDLGLPEQRSRDGKLLGWGARPPLPEITTLVADLLRSGGIGSGEGYYRYMAGSSHSTLYVVLQQFEFTLTEDPTKAKMESKLEVSTLWSATRVAVGAYLTAQRRLADLFGWDIALFDSWQKAADERIAGVLRSLPKSGAGQAPTS